MIEHEWICTSSSVCILRLLVWCSCRTPNSGSGVSLTFFACSQNPFPPTGLPCPTLIWGFVTSRIVSCYAEFSWYQWEACSFLKGNRGGVDRAVEGVEREKLQLVCIENKQTKKTQGFVGWENIELQPLPRQQSSISWWGWEMWASLAPVYKFCNPQWCLTTSSKLLKIN